MYLHVKRSFSLGDDNQRKLKHKQMIGMLPHKLQERCQLSFETSNVCEFDGKVLSRPTLLDLNDDTISTRPKFANPIVFERMPNQLRYIALQRNKEQCFSFTNCSNEASRWASCSPNANRGHKSKHSV